MRDYKLPRKKKAKARLLSPAGYVAVLLLIIFALVFALAARRVWREAHKPLPKVDTSIGMLRHARDTEKAL